MTMRFVGNGVADPFEKSASSLSDDVDHAARRMQLLRRAAAYARSASAAMRRASGFGGRREVDEEVAACGAMSQSVRRIDLRGDAARARAMSENSAKTVASRSSQ